jgi:dTMP kinase
MARGWFITLEGGEGAGKTSRMAFVRDWLARAGHDVVVTREPGGTAAGERLRELLLHAHELSLSAQTEVLLMFAARLEHLEKVIRPALAAGRTVLCDRFTDATYAYQGGGRGVPEERIAVLERWVQDGLKPDLTLLLDVPVAVGLARKGGETPDRFERENHDFLERVRRAYLQRAEREPARVRVIDASQAADKVERDIAAALAAAVRGRAPASEG